MIHGSYFETNTTALAMALYALGHKLEKWRNLYSPERLKALRCKTIEEAVGRGLAGEVTYYFKPTPEIKRLVKAWGAEEAAFDANQPFELPNATAQEFMAMACAMSKNARIFNKLWKDVTPTVFVPNEGESTITPNTYGRGVTLKTPGFRMCSLNASKEIKEKLRIE